MSEDRSGYEIKIKSKRLLRKTTSNNYYIDKKLFDFFIAKHEYFLTRHAHGKALPWCALLGWKDDRVVSRLVKLYASSGGCWNMPNVTTNMLAETAVKLAVRGYSICGMVRIGKFNVDIKDGMRGPGLQELGKAAPGFFMISLGLEGMKIESYDSKEEKYLEHGWYVVKTKGGCHGQESEESESVEGSGERTDKGDVRKADRADRLFGAPQSNDSARVPEPSSTGVLVSGSSEQEVRRDGLRAAKRRRNHDDLKSNGRVELKDAGSVAEVVMVGREARSAFIAQLKKRQQETAEERMSREEQARQVRMELRRRMDLEAAERRRMEQERAERERMEMELARERARQRAERRREEERRRQEEERVRKEEEQRRLADDSIREMDLNGIRKLFKETK